MHLKNQTAQDAGERDMRDVIPKTRAEEKMTFNVINLIIDYIFCFFIICNRKALSLFKKLAKLDQEYYPERMGKVSKIIFHCTCDKVCYGRCGP